MWVRWNTFTPGRQRWTSTPTAPSLSSLKSSLETNISPTLVGSTVRGMAAVAEAEERGRETTSASIRGTEFVVDAAYQIQKFVGCGSFGVVCSALDAAGQAHTCTQRDTSLRTRRMRAALLLV